MTRETARRQLTWLLLTAGATSQRAHVRRRLRERSTLCRPPRRMEAR